MTLILHAQPYVTSTEGFYFRTAEEYDRQVATIDIHGLTPMVLFKDQAALVLNLPVPATLHSFVLFAHQLRRWRQKILLTTGYQSPSTLFPEIQISPSTYALCST